MLLFFLFIPVIIFGLFALYFAVVYNKLVALKNAAAAAWHQIDVQLTRRADLVGNLVETVRGYAGHEKGVLENVTAARASVSRSRSVDEAGKATGELDSALARLFAVVENYPDLKANTGFLTLQAQLNEIENSLAMARQTYNETVRRYNTSIESFPANLFASTFGFSPREYFEVPSTKTEPPKVNFS